MAYIQNGIGYTLKCDKCGTLLHREGKDKPFLSLDINELDSIAKEYGWLINKQVHKCTNPCENTYKDLGYKEWMFRIGCHTLWFDDIKDFARYYNLQDRLSFPLDKTTDECMENHLIHLPSGKTIEAVGTIDI